MINRVVLVGRITKDPELRKTASGISVVSFTLAVNRRIKKEGQPDADFINCQAWQGVADVLHKYTKKGSLIGIEGRIQTRSYDDKSGKHIYITEVVVDNLSLLEKKEKTEAHTQVDTYAPPQEQGYGNDKLDIASDDLPF